MNKQTSFVNKKDTRKICPIKSPSFSLGKTFEAVVGEVFLCFLMYYASGDGEENKKKKKTRFHKEP